MAKKALKPFPKFASDEEAERFLEQADLGDYELIAGGFRRTSGLLGWTRCTRTRA